MRWLNKLIVTLLFIIPFLFSGCVTIDGPLAKSFSSSSSSKNQNFFGDISILKEIKTELRGASNPERLASLMKQLENSDVRKILLAKLKAGDTQGMAETASDELKRLNELYVFEMRVTNDAKSYKEAGRRWGSRLAALNITANEIDIPFLKAIIKEKDEGLKYFFVHTELKQAFNKGFRQGYEDRTADLVLGPHITKAGGLIGRNTATEIVSVINEFQAGWISSLRKAIDVFIVLITEGSQADRKVFIDEFSEVYGAEYEETQRRIRENIPLMMVSKGGTKIEVDLKEVGSVLKVPATGTIKTEIYQKTFEVMGDELGRKYSHNLVKRAELIDLLRRSKPALNEVPGNNQKIIWKSFVESYNSADGDNVFSEIIKLAGWIE